MATPVTRGELREELALLRQDVLETNRRDLELWGGALLERIKESEQRLAKQLSVEITRHVSVEITRHVSVEIARHVGAIQEHMQMQFATFHEAFADLPKRVSRLEAAVFPPSDAA